MKNRRRIAHLKIIDERDAYEMTARMLRLAASLRRAEVILDQAHNAAGEGRNQEDFSAAFHGAPILRAQSAEIALKALWRIGHNEERGEPPHHHNLTKLHDALHDLIAAHVLAADRLHGDDTPVPVLAKGRIDTARAWVYVRDDRPFGGPDPPAALFRYSRTRSGDHPVEHLRGYAGILPADAFAVPIAIAVAVTIAIPITVTVAIPSPSPARASLKCREDLLPT